MKRLLTLAAAVAAFTVATVNAQSFEAIKVHFGQTVQVGGNNLPAGDYTVTMVRSNGDIPLLKFAADQGGSVMVFATRSDRAEPASRTEVQLDKNGDKEHVSRIEIEGSMMDLVFAVAHRYEN